MPKYENPTYEKLVAALHRMLVRFESLRAPEHSHFHFVVTAANRKYLIVKTGVTSELTYNVEVDGQLVRHANDLIVDRSGGSLTVHHQGPEGVVHLYILDGSKPHLLHRFAHKTGIGRQLLLEEHDILAEVHDDLEYLTLEDYRSRAIERGVRVRPMVFEY